MTEPRHLKIRKTHTNTLVLHREKLFRSTFALIFADFSSRDTIRSFRKILRHSRNLNLHEKSYYVIILANSSM